ncbi:MAG TPA: acetamidase/formamidase family protein [Gemmatimonadales bacterium]|nr:acetamidase/formamidase family protein [Gemmatimonadales bacterium]
MRIAECGMRMVWGMSLGLPSALFAQHRHYLAATPKTVAWGYYSAAAKPVLTVASGDTVDVETLLTNVPDRLAAAGVPVDQIQQSLKDIVTQVTDKGPGGHILTGPIFVQGAEPGDVLEVRILAIHYAIGYGYNGCRGFVPENCTTPGTRIIPLDTAGNVARLDSGIVIPLHPFFGSIGDAPSPDSGRVSSNPPGVHAGNLDNRSLVAGTSLFIPVHASGALLEIGDGHAAQGDGEVDQTAIETSLLGRLQLIVHKDMHFTWPRGETPTELMTMGTDRDLTKATQIATQQMIEMLMQVKGLSRMDAYRMASMAADLHIAELVDQNVGVYMTIPKSVLGVTHF